MVGSLDRRMGWNGEVRKAKGKERGAWGGMFGSGEVVDGCLWECVVGRDVIDGCLLERAVRGSEC